MTPPFPPLPFRLSVADVADSPMFGRVVFGGDARSLPGSARFEGELFAHGLQRVARNLVHGLPVNGGVSALGPPEKILRALRQMADTVYAAVAAAAGAAVVSDVSPSNSAFAELIAALYPEQPAP